MRREHAPHGLPACQELPSPLVESAEFCPPRADDVRTVPDWL